MQVDLFNQPDLTVSHNQHRGNNEILEANRSHFSGQALKVLNLMLDGKSVTSVEMAMQGIIDTRARIYSLRVNGFDISEEKIPGGKGSKRWYMTQEQISKNKNLISKTQTNN